LNNSLIKKEFNGVEIAFHGKEEINLTDLWKASGSHKNNNPYEWLRLPQTNEFINTVSKNLNTEKSRILKTTRGKGGGTWGHWQIALEYARYLSPELAMWTNQVVKERVEETANPELGIDRANQRAIAKWQKEGKSQEWIYNRIYGMGKRRLFTDKLQEHGCNRNWQYATITTDMKDGLSIDETKKRAEYDEFELKETAIAEELAALRLDKFKVDNYRECKNISAQAANHVSSFLNPLLCG
jgi:hypothetical protein